MERRAVPEPGIFDCDGVLVDSEMIFARVRGECMSAAGYPTTAEEALELGFGKNRESLTAAVERRFCRALPENFFDVLRARTAGVLYGELEAMAGVGDLLDALPGPRCVASNGHLDRVRERLALTGLLHFFDSHVFSATQVASGKPAPDLFLFAAARLGTRPGACLVVEDSIAGVDAARAAGMPAIGFDGGSHCPAGHADRLRAAGCLRVFARMADLADFLVGKPCG
jgi:HAD superfamily hydrolase (TIGR01509 family)